MRIKPFTIEEYFALYEFTTPHLLCASDCETMSVAELLQLAGTDSADLLNMRLGYTEAQGHPELRAAVSRLYNDVAPDEVVILTAPEEGIYLTMRTLLEPGDHVVVLTPAYDSLLNLAEHVSGNVDHWEILDQDGRWALDLAELDRLVTAETRLVVVNFPHNPTGLLPDKSIWQAIIDIVAARGAWLFSDEMYRGLELDPALRLPSAVDNYQRAIILSGLSKVHGLPGLRSGWVIIRDEVVRKELMNWKYYTSICPPAPSEFLALAALKAHEQLIGRNRAIIENNLTLAEAFFARWPQQFNWRPPQAGPVALVGLNELSATAYCHALAQQQGVLLLPSSCLGYGDQHVRFGFGRSNFPEAIGRYERVLTSAWSP